MQVETGAIARFESRDDAEKAGYTLALTDEQATALLSMTRKERRRWANEAIRVSNLRRMKTLRASADEEEE